LRVQIFRSESEFILPAFFLAGQATILPIGRTHLQLSVSTVQCPGCDCVWAGGNPGQPRSEPPAIAISVLINFFDCQMQSRQAVAGNDLRNWVPKTQGKNGGKQAWHNRKIGLAVWK